MRLGLPAGTIRSWKKREAWQEKRNADSVATIDVAMAEATARRLDRSRKRTAKALSESSKLTDVEKDFVSHYVNCNCGATAAMRMGHYSTYAAARQAAYKMLHKPAVRAEVQRLQAWKREAIIKAGDDVIEMHMRIAFSDITDFVSFGRRKVEAIGAFGPIMIDDPTTGEKKPLMKDVNFVDFRNSDQVDGQIMTEVKQGKNGASIKLADKQKSLDFLEKYFLLNPMDQHKIEFDKKKLEIEQKKAEAESDRPAAGVLVPDAVWRQLMNPAYAEQLTARQSMQIFFGGASSGKSFAIEGQRVVRDVMTGKHNYLICRKTARSIRRSCYNEVWKCIARMDLEAEFTRNITDMVITHRGSGCQILFSGLDDVEKVKSITPAKGVLTDILIEEATEIDYDDYKQLRKRLRGETEDVEQNKRVILLFNPINQDHWIVTEFFAGKWDDSKNAYQDDQLLIRRTTYKDNRYLTDEDRQLLENETDKYYYEVYTLGKWGVLGNLIFTNWRTESQADYIKRVNQFRNGLDFGFWPDPLAYVRCSYDRARKEVRVYRTEGGNSMTNDQIAELLKPIVGREVVTCDNLMKDCQELNNYGIQAVPAVKGPNSVMFGVKWLQRQTIIVDPRCVELILELQKYKYREDKDGHVLPEPVDRDNHWIDALRYALESIMVEVTVR